MPNGRSSLLPIFGIQTRCTGLGWYSPFLSFSWRLGNRRWLVSAYRRQRFPSAFFSLFPSATFFTALSRFSIFQTLSIRLNHLPPLIPLSRVANIRSVHTLASVQAHWGATSLPCLAFGTPGSSICPCISLTFPPSYPPWLHGRYSLPRYYGGSDSCPAPSSTRTGLLDYPSCISRHPVSTHPMRPCSGCASGSGQALPPLRLRSYRRFVGLRSLLAVSSVA
jgi:hypothetical protein